jgi:hypothetical protein
MMIDAPSGDADGVRGPTFARPACRIPRLNAAGRRRTVCIVTDRLDAAPTPHDGAPCPARLSTAARVVVAAYVVLTGLVIAAAAGLDLGALRAPIGLIGGLAAPGWLMLRASVGGRLAPGQTAALAVPLSLTICALSGTVLTLAGVKLTTLPMTLVVCAVSLACLVVAAWRGMLPSPPALHRSPGRSMQITPRIAVAGGLMMAILALAVSTVQQMVRVDDAARASTTFVGLAGKLQQAAPVPGGVRASVAFTAINSLPRTIRPRLEIAVLPGGTPPAQRTLKIAAHAQGTVREALMTRCGDEIIATLSGDGVPVRTSMLRITCRP